MQPIISLSHVTKIYNKRTVKKPALHDVSIEIMPGETVAIIGESGSGKSSLLHLIGCLDKPTSGEIHVNGFDIKHINSHRLSKLRNKTIGFVFQFFHLQPHLNIADNVSVPGMFCFTNAKTLRARAETLLNEVSLDGYQSQYPHELSGGQLQRAAVARALINKPEIILADEPTGNLDVDNADGIISLLLDINKSYGTTLIVVTHDPGVAARMQRVIHLSHGEVSL